MEDIVERLRGVGYDYDFHENSLIHAVVEEIESLRAQLVVAKAEIAREERRFSDLWEQLLATQAHAARLTRALNVAAEKFHDYAELHSLKEPTPENQEKVERNLLLSRMCDEALSTPINLDALHEALALECERLANVAGDEPEHVKALFSEWLREEADTHRAKKDGT